MKLTTKTEYLLLALIYIARKKNSEFVKIESICAKYNMPKKYLEQLLSILKNNNYLRTKRGYLGGYKLAKAASRINLAEIIRLMDGALAPTESVSKYFYSPTPLEKEAKLIKVLQEIRDFIANKLEKLKLSDLI